jgi:hypothetical protein
MKFPGGNDLYSRSVWFGNQAVRVSGPNLKAKGGLLKKQNRAFAKILVAQFQFLRDRLVTAQVRGLQVIQQAAALANHHQQPAARAVILFVGLKMLGQMVDPLRQQRNLHIGGTRVFIVRLKLFNRFRLCFHNQ